MLYTTSSMHRTQIYLPDPEYRRLLHLSEARHTSLAELIRTAVRRFLTDEAEQSARETLEATFGAWSDRVDSTESTVRRVREEWAQRERRLDPPG